MKPTLFFTLFSIAIAAISASCGSAPDVVKAPSTTAPPAPTKKKAKAPAKKTSKPIAKPVPKPNWPEPAPIETKNIPDDVSPLRHKQDDT